MLYTNLFIAVLKLASIGYYIKEKKNIINHPYCSLNYDPIKYQMQKVHYFSINFLLNSVFFCLIYKFLK